MLKDLAIILIDFLSYVLGFSMGPLVFAPMSEVCLIPFISLWKVSHHAARCMAVKL